jgi:hypothetical protein
MSDFTSEDDLDSFEGWLRYQRFDPAIQSQEMLAELRDMFDDVKKRNAATPKVGSMKLKPGDGQYYAVAVRDGSDLWTTLWVRRSPRGDVYVLVPRGDRGWDPHASYHRDGRFHSKSFGRVLGQPQNRQPLDGNFQGTEHLGMYAGHGPHSVGAVCDPAAFTGIMEVEPGILRPRGGAVVVDLAMPGVEPVSIAPWTVLQQKVFTEAVPQVVVRIASHPPLKAA